MMSNTGIPSGSADTATGALSVSGPQPAWMTLDEARKRSFTGEIVFEADPEVLAYFDNGVVYYAERRTDPSLGRRLLDAGVVDTSQLERGTVRIGDVEHLGRLFDREASVDRDAVLVLTESSTDDLIAELANQAVTTVRVIAYRHHPSGIHRWFVTRIDPSARPAAQSPYDAPMLGEFSGNPVADDDLLIEWDETDESAPSFDGGSEQPFEFSAADTVEPESDTAGDALAPPVERPEPIAIDFGPPTDAVTDAVTDGGTSELIESSSAMAPLVDTPEAPAPGDDEFEFEVAWPDGSADLVTSDVPVIEDSALFTETEDGEFRFETPELPVSGGDVDHMPDEVAEAVRRAIAAIESATAETAPLAASAAMVDDHVVVDPFDMGFEPQPAAALPVEIVEPAPSLPPVNRWGAFAPPTMEMRAEVIYAQAEQGALAAASTAATAVTEPLASDVAASDGNPSASPSLTTSGVASVVFVDEEPAGGSGDERTSALRRLIGSLRRRDH